MQSLDVGNNNDGALRMQEEAVQRLEAGGRVRTDPVGPLHLAITLNEEGASHGCDMVARPLNPGCIDHPPFIRFAPPSAAILAVTYGWSVTCLDP